MKKSIFPILAILLLMACDLSTSIIPTESPDDLAATVNSIMTEFPTIESLATKQPTSRPTSQPTLLAPIPSIQISNSGTVESTISGGTQIVKVTPSLTPTITPTFIPDDPRNTLGPYSWIDTYTNGNNWPQGSNDFTSVVFEDGKMKLSALTDQDGWRLTYPTLTNFYLEANVQTSECEKSDHFGIIFRVPDIKAANQGYFYGIQCDGKYFLKVFAENLMTSIVYAKANSAILTDQNAVNRLGIMAEQDQLTLYINGVKVNQITDTHFLSGGFGIFVGSDETKNLTVSVDEIAYWSLP